MRPTPILLKNIMNSGRNHSDPSGPSAYPLPPGNRTGSRPCSAGPGTRAQKNLPGNQNVALFPPGTLCVPASAAAKPGTVPTGGPGAYIAPAIPGPGPAPITQFSETGQPRKAKHVMKHILCMLSGIVGLALFFLFLQLERTSPALAYVLMGLCPKRFFFCVHTRGSTAPGWAQGADWPFRFWPAAWAALCAAYRISA